MTETTLPVDLLVERFGFARLRHAAGTAPEGVQVSSVATSDEHASVPSAEGCLVLGIGLEDPAAVARAWRVWSELGAAALVVREDAHDPEAAAPADAITLLTLGPEMSWMRLASMVTSDLERPVGTRADLDTTEGLQDGWGETDFYDIANSLSGLLGGPVTIEDLDSRILAFSSDQDAADEHRKRSILERRVSRSHNEELERAGVFAELFASPTPIFVVPPIPSARPRAAMRIRAGDQTLGSIWAVVDGPPTPSQSHGMVEAANVVALSMMRARLVEEARNEDRYQLVSQLVDGGRGAVDAARRLGIADTPSYVMALTYRVGHDDPTAEYQRRYRSLGKLLTTFITSVHRRAVVAPLGATIYAVIPFGGETETDHVADARRFATNLLQRLTREDVVVGFGDLYSDASQLSRSRRQADTAARTLRAGGGPDGERVAHWGALQVESLLIEMVDAMVARHESIAAPLAAVDEVEDPDQAATLTAYLEHFGDVKAAAAALFVHTNTFRYRLRKVAQRADIDLDDPDVRFALMLQQRLRLFRERLSS